MSPTARALVVIVEGLPAGLPVTVEEVQGELRATPRLRPGAADAVRADQVTLLGGHPSRADARSPVAIEIANTEWPKWEQEMSPRPGVPSGRSRRPAPATPTWRHAEVRLRRRPRRARAGISA